jgi:hypothetical protein
VVPGPVNFGRASSQPEQSPWCQPLSNDDDSLRRENEASGNGSADEFGGAFDDCKFHGKPG